MVVPAGCAGARTRANPAFLAAFLFSFFPVMAALANLPPSHFFFILCFHPKPCITSTPPSRLCLGAAWPLRCCPPAWFWGCWELPAPPAAPSARKPNRLPAPLMAMRQEKKAASRSSTSAAPRKKAPLSASAACTENAGAGPMPAPAWAMPTAGRKFRPWHRRAQRRAKPPTGNDQTAALRPTKRPSAVFCCASSLRRDPRSRHCGTCANAVAIAPMRTHGKAFGWQLPGNRPPLRVIFCSRGLAGSSPRPLQPCCGCAGDKVTRSAIECNSVLASVYSAFSKALAEATKGAGFRC